MGRKITVREDFLFIEFSDERDIDLLYLDVVLDVGVPQVHIEDCLFLSDGFWPVGGVSELGRLFFGPPLLDSDVLLVSFTCYRLNHAIFGLFVFIDSQVSLVLFTNLNIALIIQNQNPNK
jgi:hypothetical protein